MEVEPFSALFNEFKPIAICPLTHAQQKGITSGDLFRADDPLSFIANSSDLAREIDCLSVLDNELNDDGKVIRFFMKYKVKRMYHVDGVPFVINLKQTPDMLRLEYGGEYVEPLEPALRIILDILNDNYERHDPNSPALAMEDIIEASNGNVNKGTTAYRHMITLEKDGYIRLVSRRLNKYLWTITSKGRKNLGIIDTICSEPEGDEKVHLATGKTWSQEKKQAAKKAAKEGKGSKNSESKKAEDGNNRH
jgi:hypothetical protein